MVWTQAGAQGASEESPVEEIVLRPEHFEEALKNVDLQGGSSFYGDVSAGIEGADAA